MLLGVGQEIIDLGVPFPVQVWKKEKDQEEEEVSRPS